MTTKPSTLARLIALIAALLTFSACDKGDQPSETQVETLHFKASAYPYFHKFWHPICKRASTQKLAIVIKDGDETHQFTCHSAADPIKPVILHISKAGIHIGDDMGKDLEDVSLEQLKDSMSEFVEESDRPSVRLHVRNNVSGQRVNEVLWVLAHAGIKDLVAPTTKPDPGVDGGPLLQDDPSSP